MGTHCRAWSGCEMHVQGEYADFDLDVWHIHVARQIISDKRTETIVR